MQDLTIIIIGFIAIVIACVGGFLVIIGRELHSRKEESQCPECHKFWAREDLDQELMGIFQKSTLLMRGNIANWRFECAQLLLAFGLLSVVGELWSASIYHLWMPGGLW
jgi:hypothetical protein